MHVGNRGPSALSVSLLVNIGGDGGWEGGDSLNPTPPMWLVLRPVELEVVVGLKLFEILLVVTVLLLTSTAPPHVSPAMDSQ
jgi:hypothetical protein